MHGCGWDSGAARERSSALAASVASRYELGADGVGAARPGARGSRVTASRYALGAEGGGAARPGAYMCPPRNCARCLLGGGGDVEDVVRCALLERLGARRASSSCGGRGWGGTPRGPCCHRLRHTRAEHRYGGSWQEGGARAASPPLQGLAPPARRPRAAGAPWEARARAARVQTACEEPCGGGWWWWQQLRITSGRLPLIGGSATTTTTTTQQPHKVFARPFEVERSLSPPEPSGGRPWEAAFGQRHPSRPASRRSIGRPRHLEPDR